MSSQDTIFFHFKKVTAFITAFIFFITAFMICAQSADAQTDENKKQAMEAFAQADQAFKAGKWEEAIKFFQKTYDLYPMPVLKKNLALTYEKMNDLEKAESLLEDFLKTAEDKNGSGAEKLKEIKEKLKQWTVIEIKSNPTGADIHIDQLKYPSRGKTPLTFKVPTDAPVKIFIKLQGNETLSQSIKFTKKDTIQKKTYQFKSTKNAFVSISSQPKSVKIKIDDKKEYQNTPQLLELSLGKHKIEISADGYESQIQEITLDAKNTKKAPLSVDFKLLQSKPKATITLSINEDQAKVYINGELKGESPISTISLAPDTYTIEVKGKAGQFKEEIVLSEKENLKLQINLQNAAVPISMEKISIGIAATGTVALLAGAVFTGLAFSSSADLDDCRANPNCARTKQDYDLSSDVKQQAFLSDVLVISGLVIGATGAVLYLMNKAPSASAPKIDVTPTVGGASIKAAFEF
jgi:hypothetical protein